MDVYLRYSLGIGCFWDLTSWFFVVSPPFRFGYFDLFLIDNFFSSSRRKFIVFDNISWIHLKPKTIQIYSLSEIGLLNKLSTFSFYYYRYFFSSVVLCGHVWKIHCHWLINVLKWEHVNMVFTSLIFICWIIFEKCFMEAIVNSRKLCKF